MIDRDAWLEDGQYLTNQILTSRNDVIGSQPFVRELGQVRLRGKNCRIATHWATIKGVSAACPVCSQHPELVLAQLSARVFLEAFELSFTLGLDFPPDDRLCLDSAFAYWT